MAIIQASFMTGMEMKILVLRENYRPDYFQNFFYKICGLLRVFKSSNLCQMSHFKSLITRPTKARHGPSKIHFSNFKTNLIKKGRQKFIMYYALCYSSRVSWYPDVCEMSHFKVSHWQPNPFPFHVVPQVHVYEFS